MLNKLIVLRYLNIQRYSRNNESNNKDCNEFSITFKKALIRKNIGETKATDFQKNVIKYHFNVAHKANF